MCGVASRFALISMDAYTQRTGAHPFRQLAHTHRRVEAPISTPGNIYTHDKRMRAPVTRTLAKTKRAPRMCEIWEITNQFITYEWMARIRTQTDASTQHRWHDDVAHIMQCISSTCFAERLMFFFR